MLLFESSISVVMSYHVKTGAHLAELPSPTLLVSLQVVTVTHSAPAPNPPFWLLVIQMVSFSSLAWEFSAADDSSANSTVSNTLIDPDRVNVLFLVAAERDA